MPTGISDLGVKNYDDSMLTNLPVKLDVPLVDVWNEASVVHNSGPLPGWDKGNSYSYGSSSWLERLTGSYLLMCDPKWYLAYEVVMTARVYHGDILTSDYAVHVLDSIFN